MLSLCGEDLSDEDIIANTPEYLPILDELKGRTVDEYRKIIKGKQSAINGELQAIPQRIAEARLAIPGNLEDVKESDIALHEEKIAEFKEKLNKLHNVVNDAEIDNLLSKKQSIELQAPNTIEFKNKRQEIELQKRQQENEIVALQREIASCKEYIECLLSKAEYLRAKWHEVNESVYDGSDICPTCKQTLPTDEIEIAKVNFNTLRAEQIETITTDGKKVRAIIEEQTKIKEKLLEKIKNAKFLVEGFNEEIYKYSCLIADETNRCDENKKLEIAKIDEYIVELKKNTQTSVEKIKVQEDMLTNQITEETAKIEQIRKVLAMLEFSNKQGLRVAELSSDEKRLAKEYAELEKTAFLLEQFTKHKIKLLSENINKFFKNAKFKLFDVQINGGITECCETTYEGIEYSNLNNAARIQIGIDIIQTLCKHYGKQAVIITDNAESINEIPQTESQQINLYVSMDNPLRIEQF